MSINANVGSCEIKQEEIDLKESFFQNNNQNNKLGVSIAERRAATRGFDASNINSAWFKSNAVDEGGVQSQTVRSPYFTIPPGISPSELLDSPVMLPNTQAQLSPTTGTIQFSPNHENLKLKLKLSYTAAMESSSESSAKVFPHSVSKNLKVENEQYGELKYPSDLQEMANKNCFIDGLAFSGIGVKSWSETESQSTMQPFRNQIFNQREQTGKDRTMTPNRDKKGPSFPKEVAKYSEDGYYWRKYGQKQVKGSEYPRSYFKCTNTNCLVKKKVERSHDGQITEIEYKGSHNHQKPQPLKRFGDTLEINDGSSSKGEAIIDNQDVIAFGSDWRIDGQDGISSSSFPSDFYDPFSKKMNIENQELWSTFHSSENRHGADQASPESINNDYDESEPKRRKRESCPNETSTISRSTREPRVVVQIESEIDILDDGYRWRKYGQKVVKGNPNPRSYYKCTTPGCLVRKHVERAANDKKSVITTYEGKHNHEVPCSKNGTLVISDVANLPRDVTNSTAQKPAHMQNKSGKQVQDHVPLFAERKPFLNYNEFMRSNMHSNFPADLNFGASSIYPLPFPPLPSIPYSSLFLNGNNHMKNFPSSNVYPMLPDYMTLQSPMNHVLGSGNVPFGGGTFHVNNYHQAVKCQSKTVKPKEEQRDEVGMYNAYLSIPNHGNRTI